MRESLARAVGDRCFGESLGVLGRTSAKISILACLGRGWALPPRVRLRTFVHPFAISQGQTRATTSIMDEDGDEGYTLHIGKWKRVSIYDDEDGLSRKTTMPRITSSSGPENIDHNPAPQRGLRVFYRVTNARNGF